MEGVPDQLQFTEEPEILAWGRVGEWRAVILGILRSNCLGAHRDLAWERRNSQSGPFRTPDPYLVDHLGFL